MYLVTIGREYTDVTAHYLLQKLLQFVTRCVW